MTDLFKFSEWQLVLTSSRGVFIVLLNHLTNLPVGQFEPANIQCGFQLWEIYISISILVHLKISMTKIWNEYHIWWSETISIAMKIFHASSYTTMRLLLVFFFAIMKNNLFHAGKMTHQMLMILRKMKNFVWQSERNDTWYWTINSSQYLHNKLIKVVPSKKKSIILLTAIYVTNIYLADLSMDYFQVSHDCTSVVA